MNNDNFRQVYNTIAEHFSLTRKKALSPQLVNFKQYLKDGQQVLDLGCGSGRLIRILKDFKIDCVFVDISVKLLNYAQEEDLGKIKNAKFLNQDMLYSSFSKNSFDLIFCIAAFHHLQSKKDRVKFLKNVYSWLKPGGYFLMTNWNLMQKKYFRYFFNFSKHSWNDFMIPYKNNQGKILTQRYYHSFTKSELNNLFLKSGFFVENIFFSENGNDLISIVQKS